MEFEMFHNIMAYYIYIIRCEQWRRGVYQRDLYYTGMAGNVKQRLAEHRAGIRSGFMQKYGLSPKDVVYVELVGNNYYGALRREKEIKKMSTKKRTKLIEDYK